jgi:uncharacterized protein (TIGR02001 family)
MRASASLSVVLGIATLASAARGVAGDLGGSLALTSDYVYQGISRTCGGPAAQADLRFRSAGGEAPWETFAGVWGSAGLARSLCNASREIDLYAGQRIALGGSSSLTLTYVHYAFPGGSYVYERLEGRRFDYDELGGMWALEDRLFVTLAWTPNALEYRLYPAAGAYTLARDRSALSFGAQVHQPLPAGLTLSAGAGYDEVSDPFGAGYAFWSAGIGRTVGRVELDVSYFRTAPRAERLFGPKIAGGRLSAAAVWRF